MLGITSTGLYTLVNNCEKEQQIKRQMHINLYDMTCHDARRAEELIRESSLGSPYFLYVSLTMVHAPFQVAVVIQDLYILCLRNGIGLSLQWARLSHSLSCDSFACYYRLFSFSPHSSNICSCLVVSLISIQASFQDDKERGIPTEPSLELKRTMVVALDRAVGRIVDAVKASEAGESGTVLVFMSDNGGRLLSDHPELQPNFPLNGGKGEVYEGGTRVPGLVWGGGTPKNVTYGGLFHMVDWAATLTKLSGAVELPKDLDSLDQGGAIWKGEASPRSEMVYNVDEGGLPGVTGKQESKWQVAVRRGDFKLILGAVGMIKRDGSSKNSLKTRVSSGIIDAVIIAIFQLLGYFLNIVIQ